jgi:thiol-disulfide isomerase/thioredoxin
MGSVLVMLLNSGCDEGASALRPVIWTFHLNDSTSLELLGTYAPDALQLFNGPETLQAKAVGPDSFALAPFDGIIAGRWENERFEGSWNDQLRTDYRIRLTATESPDLPPAKENNEPWQHWDAYLPANDSVSFGTLMLRVSQTSIQGTIATPTGDFRHLHGAPQPDGTWEFGTFDGAHLYHLRTMPAKGGIFGTFHSGNHFASTFRAEPRTQVPDLEPLSAPLKDSLQFEFMTLGRNSERVTWTLENLPGEITVIDIMGTWCPNCLDEINLLKELSMRYPDVAFMSVAFERGADQHPEVAWEHLDRYRNNLEVTWPMHLGGPASKEKAGQAFPFLERIASFPTTVFVHRDGRILTHSGFYGPATGGAFQNEVKAFEQNIQSLMN